MAWITRGTADHVLGAEALDEAGGERLQRLAGRVLLRAAKDLRQLDQVLGVPERVPVGGADEVAGEPGLVGVRVAEHRPVHQPGVELTQLAVGELRTGGELVGDLGPERAARQLDRRLADLGELACDRRTDRLDRGRDLALPSPRASRAATRT